MRLPSAELVKDLISKDSRVDSRKFLEYREIKCEVGVIQKAEGSCYVSIGDTKVIAGIKFDLMEPYEDTPDEGGLVVTLNYVPIVFQDSNQNVDIEYSRILDRSIRESEMINLNEFCKVPGKEAIQIYIDCYIINHDGNLLDALNLAAVKALSNTNMPKIENGKIEMTNKKINLRALPILVTISKIKNKFLVDLNRAEEKAIDYSIAISYLNDNEICAIQKMGTEGIKLNELEKIIEIGKEKQRELRKFL
jgi:exosome complex component RRP42